MRLKLIMMLWLVCVFWELVFAFHQDLPVKSNGELLFYLDTASFQAIYNRTYQEFYYHIPLSEVKFQETATDIVDTIIVNVSIKDTLGTIKIEDWWFLPVSAKDWDTIEGRFLPDLFGMSVDPGNYLLCMSVKDVNSGKIGTTTLPFVARPFSGDSLQLSDIQFASHIARDSSGHKFVKNFLHVLPNPNRVFGKTLPMLYFYLEIYNLAPPAAESTYTVTHEILDIQQKPVRRYPPKTKTKHNQTGLEVGAINIATLNTASYLLKVTLHDNDTGESRSIMRGFWNKSLRQEPAAKVSPTSMENNATTGIQQMTDEALDVHFRQLKYIMPPDQIKLYQTLTEPAKRNFLIQFWYSLDPDRSTLENEFWDVFLARVNYANKNYSVGKTSGWLTDCGRILIKYGIPNEITREAFRTNSIPFEEWFYNLEGGMRFIFADEQGFGYYRLIYSSEETEFTDPRWQLIIGR